MASILDVKVGSGFAFLLFYACLLAYAIYSHAPFAEVAPWLAGGVGFQTGQRTLTQIALTKAGCPPASNDAETNGK